MKRIFIASSSEALKYAAEAKQLLEEDPEINVTLWSDAKFLVGSFILQSLADFRNDYDYAIFIFHPDDELNFRGNNLKSVRDNVLFEFGLFGGSIGFENCFALMPSNIKVKEPTDLMGIINARYKIVDDDSRIKSELRNGITEIKKSLNEKKKIKNEYLVRGDFRKSIVDASIHTDVVDFNLYTTWVDSIVSGSKVKADLLYWDRATAEKWIKYESFKNKNLGHIHKLSGWLRQRIKTSIDVVSLGPGSAEKDKILLQTMTRRGSANWYYPIDISSHILNDALKKITKSFDDITIKVKGIRANFDSLDSLKFVYQYTPSTNVFLLMGNTLGNYNEQNLLATIYHAMFPDDLLIIEVNKDKGDEDNAKNLSYNQLKEFIIQPLVSLGINAKTANLKFEQMNLITSDVPNTKRLVANYYLTDKEKESIGAINNVISITYSTLYKKDLLEKFLKDIGFNIEYSDETTDQLSFILKKE